MRPPGLEEIEKARRTVAGTRPTSRSRRRPCRRTSRRRWRPTREAEEFFATLTGVRRYAFLYRIQDAKRPETRAARIGKFVALLAEGKTLN